MIFNNAHIHTPQKAEERRFIESKIADFPTDRIQLIPLGRTGICIIDDSTFVLEELPE